MRTLVAETQLFNLCFTFMGRKDIYKDAVPFTSENQPENRGRKPGIPNRATVLKKWLLAELDLVHPITKEKQRGTVEDEVMLALITKARKGDVSAIKEVLDTMYGKIKDVQEVSGETEVTIRHVRNSD